MADDEHGRTPFRFGEKLRQVRERKGLTLKIVAKQAGVSESLVSQIERNRVSPAIDTLLSLTDVLDINLEFLFQEYRRGRPVQVIRSGERRTITEGTVLYEEISRPGDADGVHALEAYIMTIPPGEHTIRGSHGHPGRECGYILSGRAELQYDSRSYKLETGDSISFAASSPHLLSNRGDVPLRALWVVTPPQRFE
ncbi:MAG: cupin domain-containing protein [Spirochaetaceae bacterium]|jgi:transcriptional regulator with XRE-family HTH domain|nr:cupin domain-containing protein [Spirochaetaceae bacterium]